MHSSGRLGLAVALGCGALIKATPVLGVVFTWTFTSGVNQYANWFAPLEVVETQ